MEKIEAIEKKPAKEQAEISCYRDSVSGNLYIPGEAIQRALVAAGLFSKGKGRASLQKTVAASVLVTPEVCDLGVKNYSIDSRSAVNPPTGGRLIRHRPRLDHWECTFYIEYDDTLLTEEQLRTVVDDTGRRVGLLDFRPQKKGMFGRFMVTEWKRVP